MATFKQAFRQACKDGKSKFTWNGKSYTTELAASSAPKTSAKPTSKPSEVSRSRTTTNAGSAKSGMDNKAARVSTAGVKSNIDSSKRVKPQTSSRPPAKRGTTNAAGSGFKNASPFARGNSTPRSGCPAGYVKRGRECVKAK